MFLKRKCTPCPRAGDSRERVLFPFRMEDAHDTEDIVAGLSFDLKIIKAADILKKCRVDRSADGGGVDLHLDTADILQLAGTDEPFGTFAVAF